MSRPPRASQAAALGAGVLALASSTVGPLPAVGGLASLLALAHGVLRGNRATTQVGGAGLLGTAVVAGLVDGRTAVVLLAGPPAVVAWDAGANGVRLGELVGRDAVTLRPQVLHVAATTVVVTAAAYGAHLLYEVGAAGEAPPLALALLLPGAFVLAAVLWLGE